MKTLPLWLAVTSILISCNAWSATYQDIFNSRAAFSIGSDSITLVDVERPLTKCENNEEYVCIKSKTLSLAIPRDASKTQWVFSGSQYKIVGNSVTSHQGEAEEYQLIKVTGTYKFQLAYSRKRGVIAIKEPSGNTLLLQERCGMLAQATEGQCD